MAISSSAKTQPHYLPSGNELPPEAESAILRFAQDLQPPPNSSGTAVFPAPASVSVSATSTSLSVAASRSETVLGEIGKLIDSASSPSRAPAPLTSVVVTASWEGVVQSVDDDVFEGEFVPAGAREPRLRGSFLLSEVDPDDRELVRRGALFELVASKVKVSRKHWLPSSSIQFRRIPRRTDNDVAKALDRAQQLRKELGLQD